MDAKRILWITQTAIFIALLVSAQMFTRPFGQFVTGSCVNFIFAFMIIGIPVFPVLIPFMIAGNLILVTAISLISGKAFVNFNRHSYIRVCAAAVIGAVIKFLVLWIGIVQIALLFIPDISEPQVNALSATFSWPRKGIEKDG